MRRVGVCAASLLLVLLGKVAAVEATDIRGQVRATNRYTSAQYPLPRAVVDLYIETPRGWRFVYKYITGTDGMYYVRNLRPGTYSIQINGRLNYPVRIRNTALQDIPPIIVSY